MSAAPRAVIDVGSNTVRLLVARVAKNRVEGMHDSSEFVRLGKGVDASGDLQTDRQDAALSAITSLSKRAREMGVPHVIAVATSAVRDARNGEEFARRVKRETGIELEIISGEREAELTFLGATLDVPVGDGAIVCDLGGGSAELIYATDRGVRWAVSRQLGSGRLTERFMHHDPPTAEDVEALCEHVQKVLTELPRAHVESVIFTGGTATHLGILAGMQGSVQYLPMSKVEEVVEVATSKPATDLVEQFGIRAERAQVLAAGITTIGVIARFYGVDELVITHHGIREGALLAIAAPESLD